MAPYGTTITDIDIPFSRVVAIILKWMLASIPAVLILWLLIFALFAGITLLSGGSLAKILPAILPK